MASTDIVTLTEAQDYLRQNGGQDSPLLAMFITSASAAIDDLCGPVVNRTVTAELHDGGTELIEVRHAPISSITSVTEYTAAGTGTVLTAESVSSKPAAGYLADLSKGTIRRRASGGRYRFEPGERNVAVTYVAGRAASTAAVSAVFKLACLVQLAHVWRVELGTGNTFGNETFTPTGFAVPNRVRELLGDEVRSKVTVA